MMRDSEMIKHALRTLLDLLLIIFLIPFAFVFVYFFPLFFTGTNMEGLVRSLAKFAFHVAWVSAPLLVAAVLVLKLMIRRELRWFAVLLASFAAGALWLAAWNLIVEPLFTLWRSVIPLTLCCLSAMAYVMGRTLYQDDRLNFSDAPDPELWETGRSASLDKVAEVAADADADTDADADADTDRVRP